MGFVVAMVDFRQRLQWHALVCSVVRNHRNFGRHGLDFIGECFGVPSADE